MAKADAEFITGKPVRIPKALRAAMEAAVEAHFSAIEKLTAVLDKADGDPEMEPSLGYRMGYGGDIIDQRHLASRDTEDLEDEHDGREPENFI